MNDATLLSCVEAADVVLAATHTLQVALKEGRLRLALSRLDRRFTGAHVAYIPSVIEPRHTLGICAKCGPIVAVDADCKCEACGIQIRRDGAPALEASEGRWHAASDGDDVANIDALPQTSLRHRRIGAPLRPSHADDTRSSVPHGNAIPSEYKELVAADTSRAVVVRDAACDPRQWYGSTASPELRRAQLAFADAVVAASALAAARFKLQRAMPPEAL